MSTKDSTPTSPVQSQLDIFPPEIWVKIFENLKDWKDYANCYTTCAVFREILEEKKWVWLFNAILPYLASRNHRAVLKCRLVCRNWANCIDNYLTNSKSPLDETNHNQNWARGMHVISLLPVKSGAEKDAMDEMKQHPRNPFTGRSVLVTKNAVGPGQELLPQLEIFLPDFGHHIHHLQIHFRFEKTSDIYRSIVAILSKCEALRSFRIVLDMAQNIFNKKENLNEDVTLPEVPCNPCLDTLIFEKHCDSAAIQLQEKLLPVYFAQLKQVQLFGWDMENYAKLNWHKLERLQILSNFLFYEVVDMVSFLDSLELSIVPNLQQLGLIWQEKAKNEEAFLKALLDLTHRFPKLHTIHLSFTGNINFGLEIQNSFQQSLLQGVKSAATLKTLDVNIPRRSNVDLWFLRYFTSLKTLQLNMGLEEAATAVARLEFTYGTQLWQALPNLQTIRLTPFMHRYGSCLKREQIKIIEYSRQGFNAYNLEEQKRIETD